MAHGANRIENPGFFKPVERSDRSSNKLPNFCDQFFSFSKTKWTVTYQETQSTKKLYEITGRQSCTQHPYLSTFTKIALIGVGFWKFKGLTSSLLLGAFILKCRMRMREEFSRPAPPPPVPSPEASPTLTAQRIDHGSNEEKWRNKWISTALFLFFAMGLRMDNVEEYARRVSEEAPDQLIVTIGENKDVFPKAFVDQSFFLMAMLNSPMIEGLAAQAEPGTLKLKDRDLPFDLKLLKQISDKWLNPISCGWEPDELLALSFLGLDPAVKQISPNMGSLRSLLSSDWKRHIPLEWSDAPPITKVTSIGYVFFPDLGYTINPAEFRRLKEQLLVHARAIIDCSDLPIFKKHYYTNKLVSDFIVALNCEYTSQIIPSLLEAIRAIPKLGDFITVLDLPPKTDYTQLNHLLQCLKNLFWLKTGDPWGCARPDIEAFPACPSIKVVSFEGDVVGRDHLAEKMPYLIMED
mgnify:CR=1 FL=1